MNHEVLLWATVLADITAKATLVLAATWLGTRAARRAPAAARHLIWMISLGTLLMLPVLEAVAPRRTLLSIPSETLVSAEQPAFVSTLPPAGDAQTGIDEALPIDFAAAQPVPASSNPVNLVIWVGGAWAGGCAVVLSSALIGLVALNRIKARALPLPSTANAAGGGRRVRLRVSREGRPPSALTWGALHPTILLPRAAEEWPQERLETVLLHELEHVRRCDAAMQLIGIAACALYWFHPAVWLAAKAARTEAEAATDDAVLRRGVRPSAYANTLMEVAAEIGRRPHFVSPTGVAFMKKSKIEARLRAILDGRTRRSVTRTEKTVAVTIAVAILVPLAFVRAAAVAPFAALPDYSDPFVSIHVTPHVTHQKLNKKQLAAQRAHHLRALAMLDVLAAQRKRAADLILRSKDLASLSPEQAKQVLDAEKLYQDIKDGSGGTSNDPVLLDANGTVLLDANGGVIGSMPGAKLAELNLKLGKLVQVKGADRGSSAANASLKLAQSLTKGTQVARLTAVKGLLSQLDAHGMNAAIANSLTTLLDAKGSADVALATGQGLRAQLDVKEMNLALAKSLTSQLDIKGADSTLAVASDLLATLDAKGMAPMLAKNLNSHLSAKGMDAALASVKGLMSQLDAKGVDPMPARSLTSQLSAEKAAAALAMEKGMTAQDRAEKGSQDALRRNLEADRAMLAAHKAAIRMIEAQLRSLQAQKAGLAAQTGQAKAEQLKMLEFKRAALADARSQLQNMGGQSADARHQTSSSLFTKDRAKLAQQSYNAVVRAQRDALNKQVRDLYGTHRLNGYSSLYSAKQRKAMLERERAALVARLKAIEVELGKKSK